MYDRMTKARYLNPRSFESYYIAWSVNLTKSFLVIIYVFRMNRSELTNKKLVHCNFSWTSQAYECLEISSRGLNNDCTFHIRQWIWHVQLTLVDAVVARVPSRDAKRLNVHDRTVSDSHSLRIYRGRRLLCETVTSPPQSWDKPGEIASSPPSQSLPQGKMGLLPCHYSALLRGNPDYWRRSLAAVPSLPSGWGLLSLGRWRT